MSEHEADLAVPLWRVAEAAREHGVCTCGHYPGYPYGDRHAPECDTDDDLLDALADLDAKVEEMP